MKQLLSTLAVLALASGVTAQETRELGAHEHGHTALDIAFEGNEVSIDLQAPGDDIVGFEHAPSSAEDRGAVDAAIVALADPLSLFVMPDAAGCSATDVSTEVVYGHGEGEEHENREGEMEGGEGHSEFQARYRLRCDDPGAIDGIDFAFFETFPNAEELDIQMVSDAGSTGLEVTREDPTLDLAGRI